MIRNYLIIAWRSLRRNQGFSLINILGLCAGLTCFMLIMLYVRSESGYDTFHEDSDAIYRVALERKYPGRSRQYAIIPHSFAEAFTQEFPEVENSCRLFFFNNITYVKDGPEVREENHWIWADSTFFDLFSIPLLVGDAQKALSEPNSIVLTEAAAERYFGSDWRSQQVVGEVLDIVANDNDRQITGVCANIPQESHLVGDIIESSKSFGFLEQPNYINFSAYTYLRLNPQANVAALESRIPDLVVKYASGPVLESFGVDYAQYQQQGNGYRYFLQPLPDIYLDSNLENEMKPPGSRSRIHFFVLIAILIIAIAAINFMNLSTARSTNRAREVGIRKTLGSERGQLIRQFLFEAVVLAVVAGLLAVIITALLLPAFNQLTHKALSLQEITQPSFLAMVGMLILGTGLIAGIYPALFLSGFSPLQAMRGKVDGGKGSLLLRNGLVVFQFSISIFLIVATMMVYRQLQFTQNKQLGFSKDSLVTLQSTGRLDGVETETFKNQLKNIPGVVAVGGCSNQPGESFPGTSFRAQGASETTTGSAIWIDEGYLDCMAMELVDGRAFSEEYEDSTSMLINQSAMREMGLTNPIGTQVTTQDDFLNADPENPTQYTIVGVVDDYHFQSLHHQITPLFFLHNSRNFTPGSDNQIPVRLQGENVPAALAAIEKIWNRFEPETPFRHAFLDHQWAALYDQEVTSRKVFGLFSLLAIFIACLGLLALANYMTEQRIKEIGIRKVLGATTGGIVALLSRNYILLVGLSILIAVPLAYYFLDQWLQGFAYRASLAWWVFATGGLIAIIIAGSTVAYTGIRAAISDPMKSLKSD